MDTTSETYKFPALDAVWRVMSAAQAMLALLGLTVVLAAAFVATLPLPREAMVKELLAWTDGWEVQAGNTTSGTIQPGADSKISREQRAVAGFISKRYRVAQDAIDGFVATAYRAGSEWKVDPLLILAVMAVESRYNPVAESNMGAKGLMQVIPKFHGDKLQEHGGETALLDPRVNIQVGAQILREYLRRFGETETALQMYAGAFDEPGAPYAIKVLAERARLKQAVARLGRGDAA